MRPRVSDEHLEALLRRGDPASESAPVSEAERTAFVARLVEAPIVASSQRRPVWAGVCVGLVVATAATLMLLRPRPALQQVAREAPAPSRRSVARIFRPLARPQETSARVLGASARPLGSLARISGPVAQVPGTSARVFRAVARPQEASAQALGSSARVFRASAQAEVTHIVLVADATCTTERPAPKAERITLVGDETSTVTVIEPPSEETSL